MDTSTQNSNKKSNDLSGRKRFKAGKSYPHVRIFLLIILISLIVRLIAGFYVISNDCKFLYDENGIYLRGVAFADIINGSSRDDSSKLAQQKFYMNGVWPPLHPIALGICFSIFGKSYAVARFFGIVISALISGMVFLIGMKFTSRRGSLIAAGLHIIYPGFIAHSHTLWSETLFTLLLLAAVYFSIRLIESSARWQGVKYTVLTGIFCGLLLLAKSIGLAVITAILLFVIIKKGLKKSLAYSFGIIIISVFFVLPWSIYASKVEGRFVFTNTSLPVNFYTGNASSDDIGWIDGNRFIDNYREIYSINKDTAAFKLGLKGLLNNFSSIVAKKINYLDDFFLPDMVLRINILCTIYPPMNKDLAFVIISVTSLMHYFIFILSGICLFVAYKNLKNKIIIYLLIAAHLVTILIIYSQARLNIPILTILLICVGHLADQLLSKKRTIERPIAAILSLLLVIVSIALNVLFICFVCLFVLFVVHLLAEKFKFLKLIEFRKIRNRLKLPESCMCHTIINFSIILLVLIASSQLFCQFIDNANIRTKFNSNIYHDFFKFQNYLDEMKKVNDTVILKSSGQERNDYKVTILTEDYKFKFNEANDLVWTSNENNQLVMGFIPMKSDLVLKLRIKNLHSGDEIIIEPIQPKHWNQWNDAGLDNLEFNWDNSISHYKERQIFGEIVTRFSKGKADYKDMVWSGITEELKKANLKSIICVNLSKEMLDQTIYKEDNDNRFHDQLVFRSGTKLNKILPEKFDGNLYILKYRDLLLAINQGVFYDSTVNNYLYGLLRLGKTKSTKPVKQPALCFVVHKNSDVAQSLFARMVYLRSMIRIKNKLPFTGNLYREKNVFVRQLHDFLFAQPIDPDINNRWLSEIDSKIMYLNDKNMRIVFDAAMKDLETVYY